MALTIRKKRSTGAKNRTRGNNYERKIISELKLISGDTDICSSRSESKQLDNKKIDIVDRNKTFPCYFQLKATQNVPQIKTITADVGLKDRPLCILWAAQEMREERQVNVGEWAILPKDLFYELIKTYIYEQRHQGNTGRNVDI